MSVYVLKSGRDVVEDMPRSGRPSTSTNELNIAKVKELVTENSRLSLREIAAEMLVSHESVRTILNECLGMKHVTARLVPKILDFLQKLNRLKVAEDMIDRVNSDSSFIKRIIAGDEIWIYEFDVHTSQRALKKTKKSCPSRSKLKAMLTVFFDYHGVVHSEFLPEGELVSAEYYLSVMQRLREQIRRKRPDLWEANSWILHHNNNLPSHTAEIVNEFLFYNSTNLIEQPPYSPDMAPVDFFLFPKLKSPLRSTRFDSLDDIKDITRKVLDSIPEKAFRKCFDDWISRWHNCIISGGAYFTGDTLNSNE